MSLNEKSKSVFDSAMHDTVNLAVRGSDDVADLPDTTALQPPRRGPIIDIRPHGIFLRYGPGPDFDERLVDLPGWIAPKVNRGSREAIVEFEDGRLPESALESRDVEVYFFPGYPREMIPKTRTRVIVPGLETQLQKLVEQRSRIAQERDEPWRQTHLLDLQADRTTPFGTIESIFRTISIDSSPTLEYVGIHGLSNVEASPEGGAEAPVRAIPIGISDYLTTHCAECSGHWVMDISTVEFTIFYGDVGYFGAAYKTVEIDESERLRKLIEDSRKWALAGDHIRAARVLEEAWELVPIGELVEALREIRENWPDDEELWLTVEEQVPIELVIRIADEIRLQEPDGISEEIRTALQNRRLTKSQSLSINWLFDWRKFDPDLPRPIDGEWEGISDMCD